MRQNSKRRIKRSSTSIQTERSRQRSRKRKIQENHEVGEYIDGKMCEICKGQDKEECLLLCDRCDDSYHIFCLDPPIDHLPENEWICFICSAQISDQKFKKNRRMVDLQEIHCFRCKERLNKSQYIIGTNQLNQEVKINLDNQVQLKCLYCSHLFHNICFSPRKNSLNCWECEKSIRKNGPKCHDDFMKFINSCADSIHENRCDLVLLEDLQNGNDESENYRLFRFKVPQYMTSWQSIVANEASIYYAFETKGLTYIDEQLYGKQQMPNLMEKNNPAKDSNGPIKRLHSRDEQTFEEFKKNSQKGYAGPIQIREDRVKGFYLVATQFIEPNTIISQYVGEIKTARDALQHEDNDSIFILLRTARSQESLDIVPEKYGNISRFFLGINNQLKRKGGYRKLENVKSLRFSYKGRVRLLLHTTKPIQAGQALYFDYNGSAFQEYPTNHFVI